MKKENLNYIILAVIFLILAAWGLECAKGNDFESYYDAGMRFRALSPDIYTPGTLSGMINHYPPFFSMGMVPFTVFPLFVAGYIFYAIKMALLIYMLTLLPGFYKGAKISNAAIALGFLTALRFLADDFKLGQVNTPVMALVVLALYFKEKNNLILSALLLAFSSSIKLFPALFIIYFLMKREYRYVLYSMAALLVLNLLPAIFYLDKYPALVGNFLQASVFNPALDPNSYTANQSMYAILMRFLGANPTEAQYLPFVNFMHLPFDTIRIIYYAAAGIILGFMFYMAQGKKKSLYDINVIFILSLVLPMVARKANFVMVFFPAVILFHEMFDKKSLGPLMRGLLWTAFGLLILTSDGIIGRNLSSSAEALSLIAIGAIILMKISAWQVIKEHNTAKK